MKSLCNLFCFSLLLISCENIESKQPITRFDKIIIPNYGSFGNLNNGSLSAYLASEDSVHQDIYSELNEGKKIGDGPQHIIVSNGKIYVSVVDESKIIVLNSGSMKEEKVIETGIGSGPNYMAAWGFDFIYVTDLYKNEVKKIDKNSGKVVKQIPVGDHPWQILFSGNYLFVANSGFGEGRTVSVIDPTQDIVVKTIDVAKNPNYMAATQNFVFVMCAAFYPDSAVLYKIDKFNLSKEDSVKLNDSPLSQISIDGNQLYYYLGYSGDNSGVKRIDINLKLSQPTNFSNEQGIPFFDSENHSMYLIYQGNEGQFAKLIGNQPIKKHKLGIQPSGEAVVIYKTDLE